VAKKATLEKSSSHSDDRSSEPGLREKATRLPIAAQILLTPSRRSAIASNSQDTALGEASSALRAGRRPLVQSSDAFLPCYGSLQVAMENGGEHCDFGYDFVETCGCEYERLLAGVGAHISAVKRTKAVRIWRMAPLSLAGLLRSPQFAAHSRPYGHPVSRV
jgi:hypothetical protein